MSTYAVALDCPHTTMPDVLWRVITSERETSGRWAPSAMLHDDVLQQHRLWVPRLDAWTLDTLRLVLHELAAFLPAHDPTEAEVVIEAARRRQRGRRRPGDSSRQPLLIEHVSIAVEARGWRAGVWTDENARDEDQRQPGDLRPPPSAGEWSEPMAAALLDLASKSPLSLAAVGIEHSYRLSLPSRRDVVSGDFDASDVDSELVDHAAKALRALVASTQPHHMARSLAAFRRALDLVSDEERDA